MKIVISFIGLLVLFATTGCQTEDQSKPHFGEAPGYPYVVKPYNQGP
jgi:hypothetical protein